LHGYIDALQRMECTMKATADGFVADVNAVVFNHKTMLALEKHTVTGEDVLTCRTVASRMLTHMRNQDGVTSIIAGEIARKLTAELEGKRMRDQIAAFNSGRQ